MRKVIYILFLLAFTTPLFIKSFAHAAELFRKDLPVEIEADQLSYDKVGNKYTAVGSVVLSQQGFTLYADRVELDMTTRYAHASGNLRAIDEGGNVATAAKLEILIDERIGFLLDGTLFFKQENIYVKSAEIQKIGPESYTALESSYTACDCEEGEKPFWSFRSKDSKVTMGEYYTGRGVTFRIKDRPILYTPYIRIPVDRKRQTGFLMPETGFSDLRGFKFRLPLYLAIADNIDATLYFDMETERGSGEGVEFRALWDSTSETYLNLAHFREDDMERVRTFRSDSLNLSRPMTADEERWRVELYQRLDFGNGFVFRADIDEVSDDEYFIDFSVEDQQRSLDYLESNVSITKNWRRFSLRAEAM
ncbi:MAG: LPS assembly protein LptD, partial [Thermodesulfobacteriota bacterium]